MILLITLTIFVAAFGWLLRVGLRYIPLIGYTAKRFLDLISFPGEVAHFTGHIIGGYFADQNFRIVYRAHPKFSYAAGYLVPATYPSQHQSRSSITKEDIQTQSLFLNLRRTTTVVLTPFPFILLLMGIAFVLFSMISSVMDSTAIGLIYIWIHLSLAYHWLPDEQDIYSIFNALIMIHLGSLFIGFAAICVVLFVVALSFLVVWPQPAIALLVTTYSPFSVKVFGTLVGMMFALLAFSATIIHLKFGKSSETTKAIADDAWVNTVHLWKIQHGNRLYSTASSTEPTTQTGSANSPFTTKSLLWRVVKILLIIIIAFVVFGMLIFSLF